MRIVCISDIHGKFQEFNKAHDIDDDSYRADVCVCAGDITNNGELYQVRKFTEWVNQLNCSYYITIAGNHDWCFYRDYQKEEAKLILKDAGIIYLENQEVIINGVKFWGSPATREFCNWAFNYTEEQLVRIWETIPDDVNVLTTHSMPKDILDYTPYECINVGEVGLKMRIPQLKQLKLYVGGHLHYYGGQSKVVDDVTYVNAALCDERYSPIQKPIVVDI